MGTMPPMLSNSISSSTTDRPLTGNGDLPLLSPTTIAINIGRQYERDYIPDQFEGHNVTNANFIGIYKPIKAVQGNCLLIKRLFSAKGTPPLLFLNADSIYLLAPEEKIVSFSSEVYTDVDRFYIYGYTETLHMAYISANEHSSNYEPSGLPKVTHWCLGKPDETRMSRFESVTAATASPQVEQLSARPHRTLSTSSASSTASNAGRNPDRPKFPQERAGTCDQTLTDKTVAVTVTREKEPVRHQARSILATSRAPRWRNSASKAYTTRPCGACNDCRNRIYQKRQLQREQRQFRRQTAAKQREFINRINLLSRQNWCQQPIVSTKPKNDRR